MLIAPGIRTTIPAKMISEIPLPIPRSVICSPSHMMNAVPLVSVSTVIAWNCQPGLITVSGPKAPPWSEKERIVPWTTDRTTVP